MTTTSQAMTQFLTDISATEYQKASTIRARKDRVAEILTEAFPPTSDLPFSHASLMGSAAKGTIIRPIDDIDVLAVFSNVNGAWSTYSQNSQAFLYRVRRAYSGISTAPVGARGQAVRVFFKTGGHVDVAPVFSRGNDVYWLPGGDGRWITTAPLAANTWFASRNRDLQYNLVPLVRLAKKWNNAHSKRLRSFHLETIAANTFATLGSNRQNALARLFEWAPSHLDVTDPGGQSGSLGTYLTWDGRREVTQAFGAAAERARRAIDAEADGDHAEAKRLWRIILGPDFPA